jgi:hypothetical protein
VLTTPLRIGNALGVAVIRIVKMSLVFLVTVAVALALPVRLLPKHTGRDGPLTTVAGTARPIQG